MSKKIPGITMVCSLSSSSKKVYDVKPMELDKSNGGGMVRRRTRPLFNGCGRSSRFNQM